MKIVVIGSGAREHALVWKIKQHYPSAELIVAPGNAGTEEIADNLIVDLENIDDLVIKVKNLQPNLVIVGPEKSLAAGIVNRLNKLNIPVFGPTWEAARIESSKSFAIDIMNDASVPHPKSQVCYSKGYAVNFLKTKCLFPIVIKADGLASGKGVCVCETLPGAIEAIDKCMDARPNEPIIIQEFLEGKEVSVFGFTDGNTLSSLVAACDHKRAYDGDKGPNTGGMGSFAWPLFWNDAFASYVARNLMYPVINNMRESGYPFVGMLYAGLIITKDGPKVLEFNARFGDPETQVIMPLLETDPLKIMFACISGKLNKIPIYWNKNMACVGVVMASKGYPDKPEAGFAVSGLDQKPNDSDVLIFHGNTRKVESDGKIEIIAGGGRILTIVGIDRKGSLFVAGERAYAIADSTNFPDELFHRSDIVL